MLVESSAKSWKFENTFGLTKLNWWKAGIKTLHASGSGKVIQFDVWLICVHEMLDLSGKRISRILCSCCNLCQVVNSSEAQSRPQLFLLCMYYYSMQSSRPLRPVLYHISTNTTRIAGSTTHLKPKANKPRWWVIISSKPVTSCVSLACGCFLLRTMTTLRSWRINVACET